MTDRTPPSRVVIHSRLLVGLDAKLTRESVRLQAMPSDKLLASLGKLFVKSSVSGVVCDVMYSINRVLQQ